MPDTEIALFDQWAPRYDGAVAECTTYYERYDDVLAGVMEHAGVQPGMLVLDIGTGTGNLALRCRERGARVIGVDPSLGMLAVAREKAAGIDLLEFAYVADPFRRLPYSDATFDAVVSTYAFHHVPTAEKPIALAEMLRVIHVGGVLAIGDITFEDAADEANAFRQYDWLEEEAFMRLDAMRHDLRVLGQEMQFFRYTPFFGVIAVMKSCNLAGSGDDLMRASGGDRTHMGEGS